MDKVKNIIYKVKNDQRKCFYIGYASKGLKYRKKSHKNGCFTKQENTKFYNFIRKYGWNCFTWEILAVYSTPEELSQAEMYWLAEQKKEYSDWECLNLTEGGDGNFGWVPTEEQRKNISKRMKGNIPWNKGKKCPEISGSNNPNFNNHKLAGENNPRFGKGFLQLGEKNPNAKSVILVSPEGVEYKLLGYEPFCREHQLNPRAITQVLKNQRKRHKGWTGKYLENHK